MVLEVTLEIEPDVAPEVPEKDKRTGEIGVTAYATPLLLAVMLVVTKPTGSVVAVAFWAEALVARAAAKREASASFTGSFMILVVWGC
jgi:hypothetical protein